jgi:hypothetical protein
MADPQIDIYIALLRKALPYVPPIPVGKIRSLHRKGDLAGVVKLIRKTMNVNVHLTLHWTSAPAWIRAPQKMPYYGTEAFKQVRADMFISKAFARTSSYDQFAIAIAHEFAHVILDSIDHPLRKLEKAVDLAAMLLGFSYLYRTAAHTVRHVGNNKLQHISLGYLSEREVEMASKLLVPMRMRARRSILQFAHDNPWLMVILVLVAAGFIFSHVDHITKMLNAAFVSR